MVFAVDDDDDDDVLLVLAVGEAEAEFATARLAAARAAWVTGMWMPSEGSESDLRRVLYGMAADVKSDKYGMRRRYLASQGITLHCCCFACFVSGGRDPRRSSTPGEKLLW